MLRALLKVRVANDGDFIPAADRSLFFFFLEIKHYLYDRYDGNR